MALTLKVLLVASAGRCCRCLSTSWADPVLAPGSADEAPRIAATPSLDAITDWFDPQFADPVPPLADRAAAPEANTSAPGSTSWVFGAHHKSGTALAGSFARFQGSATGYLLHAGLEPAQCADAQCSFGVCVLCRTTKRKIQELTSRALDSGRQMRMVHFIREPISLVISGYIYHRHAHAVSRPWVDYAKMSIEQGLEAEAQWALEYTIKDMVHASQGTSSDVLSMHLEDFTRSSESFSAAATRMYSHLLGGTGVRLLPQLLRNASQLDLHAHPLASSDLAGLTALTARANEAIWSISPALLAKMRAAGQALGYEYSESPRAQTVGARTIRSFTMGSLS